MVCWYNCVICNSNILYPYFQILFSFCWSAHRSDVITYSYKNRTLYLCQSNQSDECLASYSTQCSQSMVQTYLYVHLQVVSTLQPAEFAFAYCIHFWNLYDLSWHVIPVTFVAHNKWFFKKKKIFFRVNFTPQSNTNMGATKVNILTCHSNAEVIRIPKRYNNPYVWAMLWVHCVY